MRYGESMTVDGITSHCTDDVWRGPMFTIWPDRYNSVPGRYYRQQYDKPLTEQEQDAWVRGALDL